MPIGPPTTPLVPVRRGQVGGHARRRAAAFTLIEILVVVGILALLMTLAVIGLKVVGGVMRGRATDTAMENAKSLLAGYKLTSTPESLLDTDLVQTMCDKNGGINRWQAPLNVGVPYDVLNCCLRAPAFDATSPYALNETNAPVRLRYLQDETARVMKRLMAVPANNAAISAMPPDRILRVKYPINVTVAASTGTPDADGTPGYGTGVTYDGVVMLDGNNKPIYFVPGGGLLQVNVGYQGKGDRDDPNNYDRPNVRVQAPDKQPFWVSPGPDGDLTTGDDNVYSFDPH